MKTPSLFDTAPRFDGAVYDPVRDQDRLTRQLRRVFEAAQNWRTLQEIEAITGDPLTSISAQLRHLRKPRFGGWNVEKRRRNGGNTWEYRVVAGSGENQS